MNHWRRLLIAIALIFMAALAVRWVLISRLLSVPMEDLVTSSDVIRSLEQRLALGGDPNETSQDGNPIICIALSHHRNSGIVQLLLENGATTQVECKSGKSPYWAAVASNSKESLRLLVEYGGPPGQDEIESLIEVCRHPEIKEYLISLRDQAEL